MFASDRRMTESKSITLGSLVMKGAFGINKNLIKRVNNEQLWTRDNNINGGFGTHRVTQLTEVSDMARIVDKRRSVVVAKAVPFELSAHHASNT